MVHTQTRLPDHSLLCASYSPKSLPCASGDSFWLPGYQVSALVWIKKKYGSNLASLLPLAANRQALWEGLLGQTLFCSWFILQVHHLPADPGPRSEAWSSCK